MSSKARSPVAFGDYIITRRIARGGMAEIFRARTRATADHPSRWVAVKMMRSSLGHEDLRERLFDREARIATLLHHPNVVPVYEYGQQMDRAYLSMEYVRGRDVSHLLKDEQKGRDVLPFELGLYIGLEAAAGLGHAHRLTEENTGRELGIVHRDVSPGNVMVGYDGSVKVLDFGVARMNETQGFHTQTGTLRGKFAYMSPEQTLGEDLDARSDVFSLGTVLYELITGVNCFRAQNPISTLERVQGLRPVPPSRSQRAIPKEVDRILARCLAKDRRRRFKDAQTVQEAIGDFLGTLRYDGKKHLVEHLSKQFSWEMHEEDSELQREEEEVALFDVVDFALLRDRSELDAKNMAVSHDEQASQSEVKSVAKARRPENENAVFEGGDIASGGDEAVNRPPGALTAAALFDENIEGQKVQMTSLLQNAPPEDPTDEPTVGVELLQDPGEEERTRAILTPVPPEKPVEATKRVSLPLPADPAETSPIDLGLTDALPADISTDTFGAEPQAFAPEDTSSEATLPPAPETIDSTLSPSPSEGLLMNRRRRFRRTLFGLVAIFVFGGGAVVWALSKGDSTAPTVVAPVTIRLDAPPPESPEESPLENIVMPEGDANTLDSPAVSPPASVQRVKANGRRRNPRPPRSGARVRSRKTATGFLNIGAKPWAEIRIDGKAWPYQTPQAGIKLPVGRHTVTLHNPQTKVTKSTVVYIKSGAYKTVMMDMRRK